MILVASGPSAKDVPLEIAKGRARFIAINNSWRLAPWAEILHACDVAWWDHAKGCPEFDGIKLTVEKRAAERHPGVNLINCRKPDDRLYLEPPGTVGWGGNSGFHALNLAVQFGCAKIILVGYDMTDAYGKHWHADHPAPMNNPSPNNIARWRRGIDNAWKVIQPLGIRVINCSPISTLQAYPKMTLQEALDA